jgi:hypothetical protein
MDDEEGEWGHERHHYHLHVEQEEEIVPDPIRPELEMLERLALYRQVFKNKC